MPPTQQLIQPHPTSHLQPDQERLRLAGWLLVAGALVSLGAGAVPSMYAIYTGQAPQQFLQLVADRSDTWVGVHLAFLAGAVLTTLGLAALTSALAHNRGRALATIGLALFLLATPVRVLQTIFAATVTVTAADQTTSSGTVPPAYQLLEGFLWGSPNWALAVFIALTGIGLACYGAALLASGRLTRWLGWTFVASGLLLAISVIVFGDGPPEAVQLPLLLGGGILALRQPKPWASPPTAIGRSQPAMLSWASIFYGAGLSAVAAGAALTALARPRQPTVILTGVLATAAGPLAWNAILRATHASQFFTDAPLRLLLASWQDTGSGVFALAATAVLLGLGSLAAAPARRTIELAMLCGLAAFLVDVYLY